MIDFDRFVSDLAKRVDDLKYNHNIVVTEVHMSQGTLDDLSDAFRAKWKGPEATRPKPDDWVTTILGVTVRPKSGIKHMLSHLQASLMSDEGTLSLISLCNLYHEGEELIEENGKAKEPRPSLHQTMLHVAQDLSRRSTCARRQVGCVFVDSHGRVLSTGHNGVSKDQIHCTEVPCPGAQCPSGTGLDKCEAIHAEQNALMFCPDIMKIHACYVTASPCVTCVKMLLNTSCKEIHFLEDYPHPAAKDLWTKTRDGLTSNRSWTKHG